ELAPEIVVASQVYKWEVVLSKIIADLDKGIKGGKMYEINLKNGGLVIEFNDAYPLAADVKQAGLNAIAGIKNGSIKIGK
ncbi:BMP family ABC transporter substrate-binding protein, partial [bacterium]|nr:BMP family ABC transporter substrate-binding protein [bacterium]